HDRNARLEQAINDKPVRLLQADPDHTDGAQPPAERGQPRLAMRESALLDASSVCVDDAEAVRLARQVDPRGPLHLATSFNFGCWKARRLARYRGGCSWIGPGRGDVLSPLRVPHTAGRRWSHQGPLRGKQRWRSPGGRRPPPDPTR